MNLIKYPVIKLIAVLLLLGTMQYAKAQTGIKNIVSKIQDFNNQLPAEKLYMQFDKPYYAVDDTIWFKSYLLNPTLNYSPLSSRLYVEVVNDSSKVIRRMAFPMQLGISWGNISLEGMREGSYSIRAYTNWMRNFTQDCFFTRAFYVANPQKQTWLINAHSNLTGGATPNNVKMAVKFTSLDNEPTGLKQMQLKVLDGKKVLFKGTNQTTAEGVLDVDFPLPEKTPVKNLVLIAQEKTDAKKTVAIPVSTNRAKDVDIQFMPESGYMVAGLPAHVGFKAIGDDGRGVNISGKIINTTNGNEVLTFQSLHKGVGEFDLAPQTGDVYIAKVTLPDGQTKDVPLPAIKTSGTELRVRNIASRDSMDVFVFMTPDMVKPGGSYYLVGQSRGTVCFGAGIPTGNAFATLHISKSLFPTGIVHFTLLNQQSQPLNERLTFVNHHDDLKISIEPGQKNYAPHDSIPLKITVKDPAGKPVVGSFSIAVTDDGQVKTDSTDNIMTRFLLSSDLKGYVEDPAFYFGTDKTAWPALDALLLTQGWIGYDWNAINAMQKPTFEPEYQYSVNGKVGNLLGKPIAKANVTLLSTGKYHMITDTTTNAAGRFSIRKLPPIDSVTFVLSAQNSRHKVIKAGITVDENQPPVVNPLLLHKATPWYVNSDAAIINYVKTNPTYHQELDKAVYGPQGRLLKTVNIRNRAMIKGSSNLNGSGEADQVIDEQTIEDANKMSLGDLLEQTVKGFRVGYLPRKRSGGGGRGGRSRGGASSRSGLNTNVGSDLMYFIKDKKVQFVYDGIDVNRFFQPTDNSDDSTGSSYTPSNELYDYLKQYLDYFTAEDIKGIEVLYNQQYSSRYNLQNMDIDEIMDESPTGGTGSSTAYIEITTRSGNGPFSTTASGVYVYKPMQLTIPSEFYRPRYAYKGAGKYGDLRSTIHWQPSVVTNKSGETTVSFYAADKPSTYTIIMEGADLNGKVGYQTQKVTVSP